MQQQPCSWVSSACSLPPGAPVASWMSVSAAQAPPMPRLHRTLVRLRLHQIQKNRERKDAGARLIEALIPQPPADFADMRLYTRAPGKCGAILRVRNAIGG